MNERHVVMRCGIYVMHRLAHYGMMTCVCSCLRTTGHSNGMVEKVYSITVCSLCEQISSRYCVLTQQEQCGLWKITWRRFSSKQDHNSEGWSSPKHNSRVTTSWCDGYRQSNLQEQWRKKCTCNHQSLRQGKAKQLRLKRAPLFSREKVSCLRRDLNPQRSAS